MRLFKNTNSSLIIFIEAFSLGNIMWKIKAGLDNEMIHSTLKVMCSHSEQNYRSSTGSNTWKVYFWQIKRHFEAGYCGLFTLDEVSRDTKKLLQLVDDNGKKFLSITPGHHGSEWTHWSP